MPANPATTTVSVQSAQPREGAEGLPLIIGFDSSDGSTNVFKDYFDQAALMAVHGRTTLTGLAGEWLFKQRAERAVVVKPTRSAVVAEALGTAATGTLDNFPVSNTIAPVLRLDGAAKTVVPTTESPITTVPAAGTVLLNFATGEYRFESAGATANDADYSYFDFTSLENAYIRTKPTMGPLTFVVVPGLEATLASLGDVQALADLAERMYWFLIVQTPTDSTVAQDKAVREAINSSHVMLVKSLDANIDLAAAIAGIGSRTNAFTTLAFKEIRGISTDYFLDTEIGDVETADTYEGEGINVVHRIGNKDVLANERTAIVYSGSTAVNKDEIYASRVLAKIALKNRFDAAVNDLIVREGVKLTNAASGVSSVHTELVRVCEGAVAADEIRKGYFVGDPPELAGSMYAASLADAKRKRLGPWTVSAQMLESAHEIVINAYMEVA